MQVCYTFPKDKFPDFFSSMEQFGKVHAPVRVSDQSFAYRAVDTTGEIAFEALRTILPPKKFFYPQKETLLTYKGDEVAEALPEASRITLFGVHPCDLAGLAILDKIFLSGPGDPHYKARRDQIMIIGLSCMPDKHCFCQSMGTDSPDGGYDLFLTDIGALFFLQVHTPLGASILRDASYLTAAAATDDQAFKAFWEKRSQSFTSGFSATNLTSLMDIEKDNPVWEELGQRCLSCGNCTPVCPTCYCFDVLDIASLSGEEGERYREWDSCQFSGFAKVAGDYNFRPGPVDRLKFWYRHKLHGFDDPYGLKTCVGCGRCTVSCPAGIDDIVNVVLRIQGDQVKLNLPGVDQNA